MLFRICLLSSCLLFNCKLLVQGQASPTPIIHYSNHNYHVNATIDIYTPAPEKVQDTQSRSQSEPVWMAPGDGSQIMNPKQILQLSEWMKPSEITEEETDETARHITIRMPSESRRTGHAYYGDYDKDEDSGPLGSTKAPICAQYGRYYCSYKEDYPHEIISQVVKYMKLPLQKLFKDLKALQMPKLAELGEGALVCDSQTKVIRPGWAKNVNGRWLVVLNTSHYHQYVTEVLCKYDGSYCNFVPPCYHATCQQRYNKQTLLVIDPHHPHKGPFLSKFLFASCCVCYVPKHSKKDY